MFENVIIDEVESIQCIGSEPEYVYDLSIPDNHKYFANDVLVHNTDSIFVHLDPVLRSVLGEDYDVTSDEEKVEIVLKIIKRVALFINTHAIKQMLQYHYTDSTTCSGNKYDFKFKEELIIKRSVFLDTKKKYAIWAIQKENKKIDEMNVVGMEVVRSDYPRFTRNMMSDVLDKILKQNISKAKMLNVIDRYIEDYKKLLATGGIDAAIPCVWNNRDYIKEPIAVRGMQTYNAVYGPIFKPGDKGYRFKLDRININKLDTEQKNNLNALKENGKVKEFDTIVIPNNTSLDTSIFVPNITDMLDFAIYNRLQDLLDLFNIDVKNTNDVGW